MYNFILMSFNIHITHNFVKIYANSHTNRYEIGSGGKKGFVEKCLLYRHWNMNFDYQPPQITRLARACMCVCNSRAGEVGINGFHKLIG